jgi:hypothetical protein
MDMAQVHERERTHAHLATPCATALAMLAIVGADPAHATVLIFDQIRLGSNVVPTISGNTLPQDYGDRVSAASMQVSGGQFTYGNLGEGFTPNVEASYSTATATPNASGVSLWADAYGDLTNVAFGNQGSDTLTVRLTADAGISVLLHGFDLAGWPSTDYTIDAVRVLEQGNPVFTQTDVLVQGNQAPPRRTSFAFATPIEGRDLLIEIDYGNLADSQQDNIGIDNIRFAQSVPPDEPPPSTPIPAPASLALLGLALAALAHSRAR